MRAFAIASAAVFLAFAGLDPDARAGDWDDIDMGNPAYSVVGCIKKPDGDIVIGSSLSIFLDQFERAGINDAAIAANASGVAVNAAAISVNSASIAANTAALSGHSVAIAQGASATAANTQQIVVNAQGVANNAAALQVQGQRLTTAENGVAANTAQIQSQGQRLTVAEGGVAANAAAIAQTSAASDRSARIIAAQGAVLDDAVAQINFQNYRLDQVSLQLADHESSIRDLYGQVERLDRKIARAAALFGAMDFQRPLPGKAFRVGMGGGTFDSESAVGWTFTAVVGSVDLSVGAALASGDYGGKASVGFSF